MSGLTGYDFSASEEGEVNEAWSLVASSVPCRVDRRGSYTRRRADGMVEVGTTVLYLEIGANVLEGDRIYVDSKFYQVTDSNTIDGMKDPHHIEAIIEVIDWASPV